jgi:2-phosphosulfolactate phosphatase
VNEFSDQSQYDIRFEWGLRGLQAVASDVGAVVIVDVLSFSTCASIATARGATVFPYPWKDDAAADFARSHNAVLAGSRGDPASPFSLSPASLTGLTPGVRLVLPSPNGATLCTEAPATAAVSPGCLRNRRAVARRAQSSRGAIAVIAAGERWPDYSLRPALEDLIGAGAIIAALSGNRSPEAAGAEAVFASMADLASAVAECASGRELIERGFAEDVGLACQLDADMVAPTLRDGAFRAEYQDNLPG